MTETWRNGIVSVNNQRKWLSKHKGLEFGMIHWRIEKKKMDKCDTQKHFLFLYIFAIQLFPLVFTSLSGSMQTLYIR